MIHARSLLSLLFFLCFFRLPVQGLGTFLVIDIVSLLYFLSWPGRLRPYLRHLRYLAIGAIGALVALFATGTNEFQFLARMGLVFLDACFLARLCAGLPAQLDKELVIRQALMGYVAAAAAWVVLPEGLGNLLFYFDVPKSWVATFPALVVVYFLVLGAYKPAVVAGLCMVAFSLHPEISSRTLLLQSLLLTFYAAWKLDKKLAIVTVALAVAVVVMASSLKTELVDNQEHSNTFRLVMIAQIADFSALEWLFGRGIDAWRLKALNELFNLPGASEFFESANPHFFPAELIIRGGLMFFVSVVLLAASSLGRSPYRWIVLCMFIGSFTTTNTGVERLYFTLALCLVLKGRTKTQPAAPYSLSSSLTRDGTT